MTSYAVTTLPGGNDSGRDRHCTLRPVAARRQSARRRDRTTLEVMAACGLHPLSSKQRSVPFRSVQSV